MPTIVRTVKFDETEQQVFSTICSVSVLGEGPGTDAEAVLRLVRRAAQGDSFTSAELTRLKELLEVSMDDRQRNIEEAQEAGLDHLVPAFAQWLRPLAEAWQLAERAQAIVLGGI